MPERRRDGPGPNRFDDPDHVYVVRYLADSLRSSLLEAMARLRPESRENQQWRQQITGVDEPNEPDEHELHRTAIAEWLAVQRVATIRPAEAPGRYVDLTDPKNLDTLSHHPRVATHLGQLHQDGWIDRPLLDSAALRVSGPHGRALTQALSRPVYDAQPRPDGLRYRASTTPRGAGRCSATST